MDTSNFPIKIKKFVKQNYKTMSDSELSEAILKEFDYSMSKKALQVNRSRWGLLKDKKLPIKKERTVAEDKVEFVTKRAEKNLDKRYKTLLDENQKLEEDIKAILLINDIKPSLILNGIDHKDSEATAVCLLSDWHVDEIVNPAKVSFKNKYNQDIAKKRSEELFISLLKYVKKERTGYKIDTLILALLGDFISGNIHQELLANTSMNPINAIMFAQDLISGGIQYILKNSDLKIVVPCCVGNHSRITEKTFVSLEQGFSLEYFAYHQLKNYFKNESRVEFIVAEGYFNYLDVYKFTLRFHHGHNIRYAGGIGGIFIPAYKAVGQFNKMKYAHYDFFGHFHQRKDGEIFLTNGSLIGYNAYALAIKADYERPAQIFFIIDKKRGVNNVSKIEFHD